MPAPASTANALPSRRVTACLPDSQLSVHAPGKIGQGTNASSRGRDTLQITDTAPFLLQSTSPSNPNHYASLSLVQLHVPIL